MQSIWVNHCFRGSHSLHNYLKRMAGSTGFEPAASAVTVLCYQEHPATQKKSERDREAVFMRVCRVSAAAHLFPSDTLRHRGILAGIGGLRHKSRHKQVATLWRGLRVRLPLSCPHNRHRKERLHLQSAPGCGPLSEECCK